MAKTRRRTSERRIADKLRRASDQEARDLEWARKAARFWSKFRVGELPRVE